MNFFFRRLLFFRTRTPSTFTRQHVLSAMILTLPYVMISIIIARYCTKIRWTSNDRLLRQQAVFNLFWITSIVITPMYLPKLVAQLLMIAIFILFLALYLTHSVFFSLTGFMFSFRITSAVSEGMPYIWYALIQTPVSIWLTTVVIVALFIFAFRKYRWSSEFKGFKCLLLVLGLYVIHFLIVNSLGSLRKTANWNNFEIPRSIYETFTDPNKNMKLCGLYEYTFRDLYFVLFKPHSKPNSLDLTFLEAEYSNMSNHTSNQYTGRFRGRNVIFLQLEGFDTWMLNNETVPTLYNVSRHALSFPNHFSFTLDSGATFHSEFCVNTGFRGPITFSTNVYTLTRNSFPFSLPRKFSAAGYNPNAFHMNTREFYNRGLNYLNWGYHHYYGLLEIKHFPAGDDTYMLDRTLVEDPFFYQKLFRSQDLFLHYIITYSIHHPFTINAPFGKLLTSLNKLNASKYQTEAEAARLFAGETDHMVQLLLNALRDNQLFDKTVIVAYADHYPFTVRDKSFIEVLKNQTNNLISNTPFFIWASDLTGEIINKVNSQVDILPTVLNIFGIPYKNEHYVGKDIFDSSYPGFVIFPDGSYYDGKQYLFHWEENCTKVVQKNDLTMKYDFLKSVS